MTTPRHQFSQKKFLSLGLKQQHKKCSELLRSCIETENETMRNKWLDHYDEICAWMGFEILKNRSLEPLADRFHSHLELADLRVKEDRYFHELAQRKNTNAYDRESALSPTLDVTVYLENIRSSHNVGSIIRSAECFGFKAVAMSRSVMGPSYSGQAKRAAMGCDKWIDVQENSSLESMPRPWIALETNPEASTLSEFVLPPSFTLVVGNEEYGLSERTLGSCDACIRIPMHGRKNSLNVACAFAIAGYEIRKNLDQLLQEDLENE